MAALFGFHHHYHPPTPPTPLPPYPPTPLPPKKIENSYVLPHFGNILKNFDSAAESGGVGRWCLDKCITLQEIFNRMELKGK